MERLVDDKIPGAQWKPYHEVATVYGTHEEVKSDYQAEHFDQYLKSSAWGESLRVTLYCQQKEKYTSDGSSAGVQVTLTEVILHIFKAFVEI